jgi:hypothetical protein
MNVARISRALIAVCPCRPRAQAKAATILQGEAMGRDTGTLVGLWRLASCFVDEGARAGSLRADWPAGNETK